MGFRRRPAGGSHPLEIVSLGVAATVAPPHVDERGRRQAAAVATVSSGIRARLPRSGKAGHRHEPAPCGDRDTLATQRDRAGRPSLGEAGTMVALVPRHGRDRNRCRRSRLSAMGSNGLWHRQFLGSARSRPSCFRSSATAPHRSSICGISSVSWPSVLCWHRARRLCLGLPSTRSGPPISTTCTIGGCSGWEMRSGSSRSGRLCLPGRGPPRHPFARALRSPPKGRSCCWGCWRYRAGRSWRTQAWLGCI